MKHRLSALFGALALAAAAIWFGAGCGSSEARPVELFPEDNCAQCRMAISDAHFASEILEKSGDVHKFDDLGCMLKFRTSHTGLDIAAIYLKEYDTLAWIPYERASIVTTGISTPMGSGHVAFASPEKARAFQESHPALTSDVGASSCCEE